MKRPIKVGLGVFALAALLASGAAWPSSVGRIGAHLDLLLGEPRYLMYGELAPYESEVVQILDTRYGLEFDRVASCEVSWWTAARSDAYNAVINHDLGIEPNEDAMLSVVNDLLRKYSDE